MARRFGIGLVGCGSISGNYVKFARQFGNIEVVACADLEPARAESLARSMSIPRACGTVDDLLRDEHVDIAVNLTIPTAHAQVSLAAIEHGKHVWTEKPLATTLADGRRVFEAAWAKGVRLGGAPDTFLGSAIQTARQAIDGGLIGTPVAAVGQMLSCGHESWHPNPEFFFQPGGGPMFDMGPYYLTAMLYLLGPIRCVSAMASIAIPQRTITSQPLRGRQFTVTTPDHIAGNVTFESGCIGTLITSFAAAPGAYDHEHPLTIYGSRGALRIADPNQFDGSTLFAATDEKSWRELPVTHRQGLGRSVGVADMAAGIEHQRPHRGSAEQILCVLDVMEGFLRSAEQGVAYRVPTPYQRPTALSADDGWL